MDSDKSSRITVQIKLLAPVEKVWHYWTEPDHITKWNFASDDWQTTFSENDLRSGGKFLSRMEAKDGSSGFDFFGTYDEVKLYERISYTLGDNRKVQIDFIPNNGETILIETFDAETTYTPEKQQEGWQAILNNFKKHVEQG